MKKIILILLSIFMFTACHKQESKYDIAGKTYYNTVDEFNNNEYSKVWFGKDNSFVIYDNFYDGSYEINGKWDIKENVINLDVESSGVGEFKTIKFEIIDNDNIVLKTTLAGSKYDDSFSTSKPEIIKPETSSIEIGTYYNISQGIKVPSSVELKNDNSFILIDKSEFGISEYNGKYTLNNNIVSLKCDDHPENKTYNFLINEDKNLILQDDIAVSIKGNIFSMDFKVDNTKKEDTFNDFGTYYNINGCMQFIELNQDKSFRLVDNISGDFIEAKGLYGIEDKVLMFSNFDSFNDQNNNPVYNFIFFIEDKETIILMNDLHGSIKDAVFKKLQEAPICGIETDEDSSTSKYIYNGASTGDMNPEFYPYFELYEDASFLFYENLYAGMGTYKGKCSFMGSNMSCEVETIDFSGYAGDDVKNINFEFVDENTIILKTDLCLSRDGDEFKLQ